jgi:hypothetical protein
VAQRTICITKLYIHFSKYDFMAVNIDSTVVYVVRFKVQDISTCRPCIVCYQDNAHMPLIKDYYYQLQ